MSARLAEADGLVTDPAPGHRRHRLGVPVDSPVLFAAERAEDQVLGARAILAGLLVGLSGCVVGLLAAHFPGALESGQRVLDCVVANAVADDELMIEMR